MARKSTLPVGQVGYIGHDELFSDGEWTPCTMMSFAQTPQEVGGEAYEVQRNPQTFTLEVKMHGKVTLPYHSGATLNASAFGVVILIDEKGRRYKTTPKKYR